jgi:hypothetical protein
LPRFDRAPVRPITLMPRDIEMLRAVHRHRLLRSTHVALLFGGGRQAILRRLQLLFHHGFLDRPAMQLDWYSRGSEPMVYALGRRGAQVLELSDRTKRANAFRKTTSRNVSRTFLHHTLAVAEALVTFEAACRRDGRVSFISSEEILERAPEQTRRRRIPFRWQVEVQANGRRETLGIEPDHVFGLRFEGALETRREAYFFLEADRGTMPVHRKALAQTSFVRKILAYEATWRQKIHVSQFGLANFRVLTVAPSVERVQNLGDASRRFARGTPGLFLFIDRQSLNAGENVLYQSWINGRGEPRRLAPQAR